MSQYKRRAFMSGHTDVFVHSQPFITGTEHINSEGKLDSIENTPLVNPVETFEITIETESGVVDFQIRTDEETTLANIVDSMNQDVDVSALVTAFDHEGCLRIQTLQSGEPVAGAPSFVRILKSRSANFIDLAPLVGFHIHPHPGATVKSGDLASTPVRPTSEQNKAGATFLARGEDRASINFNRSLHQLGINDDAAEVRLTKRVAVPVVIDLDADSPRLIKDGKTILGVDLSPTAGDEYDSLLLGTDIFVGDLTANSTLSEISNCFSVMDLEEKAIVEDHLPVRVGLVTRGATQTIEQWGVTWGSENEAPQNPVPDTADPGADGLQVLGVERWIYNGINVTEIRDGCVLVCEDALFITSKVRPHDLVTLSASTISSPINHNGDYKVVSVLSETEIEIQSVHHTDVAFLNNGTANLGKIDVRKDGLFESTEDQIHLSFYPAIRSFPGDLTKPEERNAASETYENKIRLVFGTSTLLGNLPANFLIAPSVNTAEEIDAFTVRRIWRKTSFDGVYQGQRLNYVGSETGSGSKLTVSNGPLEFALNTAAFGTRPGVWRDKSVVGTLTSHSQYYTVLEIDSAQEGGAVPQDVPVRVSDLDVGKVILITVSGVTAEGAGLPVVDRSPDGYTKHIRPDEPFLITEVIGTNRLALKSLSPDLTLMSHLAGVVPDNASFAPGGGYSFSCSGFILEETISPLKAALSVVTGTGVTGNVENAAIGYTYLGHSAQKYPLKSMFEQRQINNAGGLVLDAPTANKGVGTSNLHLERIQRVLGTSGNYIESTLLKIDTGAGGQSTRCILSSALQNEIVSYKSGNIFATDVDTFLADPDYPDAGTVPNTIGKTILRIFNGPNAGFYLIDKKFNSINNLFSVTALNLRSDRNSNQDPFGFLPVMGMPLFAARGPQDGDFDAGSTVFEQFQARFNTLEDSYYAQDSLDAGTARTLSGSIEDFPTQYGCLYKVMFSAGSVAEQHIYGDSYSTSEVGITAFAEGSPRARAIQAHWLGYGSAFYIQANDVHSSSIYTTPRPAEEVINPVPGQQPNAIKAQDDALNGPYNQAIGWAIDIDVYTPAGGIGIIARAPQKRSEDILDKTATGMDIYAESASVSPYNSEDKFDNRSFADPSELPAPTKNSGYGMRVTSGTFTGLREILAAGQIEVYDDKKDSSDPAAIFRAGVLDPPSIGNPASLTLWAKKKLPVQADLPRAFYTALNDSVANEYVSSVVAIQDHRNKLLMEGTDEEKALAVEAGFTTGALTVSGSVNLRNFSPLISTSSVTSRGVYPVFSGEADVSFLNGDKLLRYFTLDGAVEIASSDLANVDRTDSELGSASINLLSFDANNGEAGNPLYSFSPTDPTLSGMGNSPHQVVMSVRANADSSIAGNPLLAKHEIYKFVGRVLEFQYDGSDQDVLNTFDPDYARTKKLFRIESVKLEYDYVESAFFWQFYLRNDHTARFDASTGQVISTGGSGEGAGNAQISSRAIAVPHLADETDSWDRKITSIRIREARWAYGWVDMAEFSIVGTYFTDSFDCHPLPFMGYSKLYPLFGLEGYDGSSTADAYYYALGASLGVPHFSGWQSTENSIGDRINQANYKYPYFSFKENIGYLDYPRITMGESGRIRYGAMRRLHDMNIWLQDLYGIKVASNDTKSAAFGGVTQYRHSVLERLELSNYFSVWVQASNSQIFSTDGRPDPNVVQPAVNSSVFMDRTEDDTNPFVSSRWVNQGDGYYPLSTDQNPPIVNELSALTGQRPVLSTDNWYSRNRESVNGENDNIIVDQVYPRYLFKKLLSRVNIRPETFTFAGQDILIEPIQGFPDTYTHQSLVTEDDDNWDGWSNEDESFSEHKCVYSPIRGGAILINQDDEESGTGGPRGVCLVGVSLSLPVNFDPERYDFRLQGLIHSSDLPPWISGGSIVAGRVASLTYQIVKDTVDGSEVIEERLLLLSRRHEDTGFVQIDEECSAGRNVRVSDPRSKMPGEFLKDNNRDDIEYRVRLLFPMMTKNSWNSISYLKRHVRLFRRFNTTGSWGSSLHSFWPDVRIFALSLVNVRANPTVISEAAVLGTLTAHEIKLRKHRTAYVPLGPAKAQFFTGDEYGYMRSSSTYPGHTQPSARLGNDTNQDPWWSGVDYAKGNAIGTDSVQGGVLSVSQGGGTWRLGTTQSTWSGHFVGCMQPYYLRSADLRKAYMGRAPAALKVVSSSYKHITSPNFEQIFLSRDVYGFSRFSESGGEGGFVNNNGENFSDDASRNIGWGKKVVKTRLPDTSSFAPDGLEITFSTSPASSIGDFWARDYVVPTETGVIDPESPWIMPEVQESKVFKRGADGISVTGTLATDPLFYQQSMLVDLIPEDYPARNVGHAYVDPDSEEAMPWHGHHLPKQLITTSFGLARSSFSEIKNTTPDLIAADNGIGYPTPSHAYYLDTTRLVLPGTTGFVVPIDLRSDAILKEVSWHVSTVPHIWRQLSPAKVGAWAELDRTYQATTGLKRQFYKHPSAGNAYDPRSFYELSEDGQGVPSYVNAGTTGMQAQWACHHDLPFKQWGASGGTTVNQAGQGVISKFPTDIQTTLSHNIEDWKDRTGIIVELRRTRLFKDNYEADWNTVRMDQGGVSELVASHVHKLSDIDPMSSVMQQQSYSCEATFLGEGRYTGVVFSAREKPRFGAQYRDHLQQPPELHLKGTFSFSSEENGDLHYKLKQDAGQFDYFLAVRFWITGPRVYTRFDQQIAKTTGYDGAPPNIDGYWFQEYSNCQHAPYFMENPSALFRRLNTEFYGSPEEVREYLETATSSQIMGGGTTYAGEEHVYNNLSSGPFERLVTRGPSFVGHPVSPPYGPAWADEERSKGVSRAFQGYSGRPDHHFNGKVTFRGARAAYWTVKP